MNCYFSESIQEGKTAEALDDYTAGDVDEISFEKGDVITDIVVVYEGWCVGTCHEERGMFPVSYVDLGGL